MRSNKIVSQRLIPIVQRERELHEYESGPSFSPAIFIHWPTQTKATRQAMLFAWIPSEGRPARPECSKSLIAAAVHFRAFAVLVIRIQ